MDALKFLKERKRMCSCYKHCEGCPLEELNCALNAADPDEDDEQVILAVELWLKKHPHKTRQSIFLEQYPEARVGDDGVLKINPCFLLESHRNARGNCATMGRECSECRREFWMQEVNDTEQ